MRNRAVFAVLLLGTPLLWGSSHKTTVSQLVQLVDEARTDHLTDDQLNQRLNNIQLVESLDSGTWQKLTDESPGQKTTEALRALYASSAFLPPSAGTVLPDAPPRIADQRAIMARTINYVLRTIPALPNLLAVRDTAHFTDTGVGFDAGNSVTRGGLLLLGEDQTPVTIRDGVETDTPAARKASATHGKENFHEARDLVSWGEFGPVLTTVLLDAAHGQLAWEHWEQSNGQRLAIFHFVVPRTASHYSVHYCCDVRYGPALDGQHQTMISVPSVLLAGYHGQLAIDPATGVIRQIRLTVDPRPGESLLRGAMRIEWGPMTVGSSPKIVPLHSVTLTTTPDKWEQRGIIQTVDRTRINETEFSAYHRFGSEARIITDVASEQPTAAPESSSGAPSGSSAPHPDAVGASSVPAGAGSSPATLAANIAGVQPPASNPVSGATTPAAVGAVATASPKPSVPAALAAAEVAVEPLQDLPQSQTGNAASPQAPFTLQANTQRVSVNLLALDHSGQPITNLRRDEIQLFDNGHPIPLSTFQQTSSETPSANPTTSQADGLTNLNPDASADNTLILLLDGGHLAFADMNQARQQVLDYLQTARRGTRFALYALDEHSFRVLQDVTSNPDAVRARLLAWQPSASATAQAQELERRDRQTFDTVHHAVDLNSVNGNYNSVPDYIDTVDPELRMLGDNPQRQLLEVMQALARHFAAVHGQKSLALISGDSALGNWEDRKVGMEQGSDHVESALQRAREIMDDAHIALYVIDASRNHGGATDSSIEFRNVELIQGSTDNNGPAGSTAGRNLTPGRITSQMESNLHGIDGPIRTLAESTGGIAVDRGSDLRKTLAQIQADSMATAELSFEPPSPPDNKLHLITVKISDRKGIKLRYRSSYLDAIPPAQTPRQQLQQAVWSPEDRSGVGISATADADPSGTTLRLRIQMKGLGLEQQSSGPAAGRWTDRLYIFVAVRNDGTHQAQISGDTLVLSLQPATYQSGMPAGIPYKRTLQLPSKLASVRVIVIDRNSGRMGSITIPASAITARS